MSEPSTCAAAPNLRPLCESLRQSLPEIKCECEPRGYITEDDAAIDAGFMRDETEDR